MTPTPPRATFTLYGRSWDVDLDACREALVIQASRQPVQIHSAKRVPARELVCQAAGVSPKTLRRFLAGERITTDSLFSIIVRGLGLSFESVATRVKRST